MQWRSIMLSKTDELKDRIDARKHELLKKFSELKADTRHEAIEARTVVKHKLDELELYLKVGWDKLTEATHTKLNDWLQKD